jgi:hypothetical protein
VMQSSDGVGEGTLAQSKELKLLRTRKVLENGGAEVTDGPHAMTKTSDVVLVG